MQKANYIGIKARGFALSNATAFYIFFMYTGMMFCLLLIIIPLIHLFPTLTGCACLLAIPPILLFVTLLLYALCYFYTIIIEPDVVIQKWFGIEVRRIPISRFKTFCAVGNKREDVLCLSCYSVEEMAQMGERRLLRSLLNKHSVPRRKRKEDWQDDFAKEYLNHLRASPFSIFSERDVIMFAMDSALQYSVCQIYSNLTYKNYTGVTSHCAPRFSVHKQNEAVCFGIQRYEYEVHMDVDGIRISTLKGREECFIAAQKIQTVVLVDIFQGYNKYYPHHIPLLFITSMSEEELAAQVSSKGYGELCLGESASQGLLAMIAATYHTLHWNRNDKDCCIIHHTENNWLTLQTLYPHIHINDIAATWLYDSVAPIDKE
jgi:hypothetical protein